MDLNYTDAERAFRDEVRAFLRDAVPDDIRDKVRNARPLERDDYLRWQRILHAKGWGSPSWPVEFGGTGWNAVERHLFDEECAFAGAPPQVPFGLRMVAPVIMKFGTPEQQQRFLPRILDGTDFWCQGYSEPGSGSDLASLKTRATLAGSGDDAHYVIEGQKTWTTWAHHADWMFVLVRTDPEARKQEGISFLLLDMHAPGVTVRKIELLDGEHEVNEVFFDGVKVPVAQRVGVENQGWTCAKFLLGHERFGSAAMGPSKALFQSLLAIARREKGDDGRSLIEDHRFRDRLALAEMEMMAMEVTGLKAITANDRAPGPEASILKIKGSELRQSLTELHALALGPYAAAKLGHDDVVDGLTERDHAATAHYFNYRKTTIYGGSNEVQRTIIAKHILGL